MNAGGGAPRTRRVAVPDGIDLADTLGALVVTAGDPCLRIRGRDAWLGATTADGPSGVHLRADPGGAAVEATAWGPGADRILAGLPALVGAHDRPGDFAPAEPLLRDLARRHPGLRIPRSNRLLDLLVPVVLGQKVTGAEAGRAWRGLVTRHGAPAPGVPGLWTPPTAAALRGLGYADLHALGVERRRADTVLRLARVVPRLQAELDADPETGGVATGGAMADTVRTRLGALPGVGPWTLGHVGLAALGDPDAVPVGDFHLPHLVSWALAREPRGDDARMLELLAPSAGHRGRALRLLQRSGLRAPRRGPRLAPRAIGRI